MLRPSILFSFKCPTFTLNSISSHENTLDSLGLGNSSLDNGRAKCPAGDSRTKCPSAICNCTDPYRRPQWPNGRQTEPRLLHAGVYKKNFEVQQPTQAGDILCRILNRDLQTLDSILIKNPLQVRTEFPDENGVIGATMLHYTEQELLLRFNYRAEMQHLLFSRFESDTETTEIATIPLIFE
jgi:hypothetical protein